MAGSAAQSRLHVLRARRECFFTAIEDEVHRTIVDNQIFSPGERVAIGASGAWGFGGGKSALRVPPSRRPLNAAREFLSPCTSDSIACAGGKDSTVLAHLLSLLNKRHGYGLDLMLVSVDEGIAGYRDDSLETVKRNEKTYGIPLRIVSYKGEWVRVSRQPPCSAWQQQHALSGAEVVCTLTPASIVRTSASADLYGWTMDEIVARIGRKNNCTFCGVFRRRALDRGAEMVGAAKVRVGGRQRRVRGS